MFSDLRIGKTIATVTPTKSGVARCLTILDATEERLKGAVPLARLFLHEGATPLQSLAAETLISVNVDEQQDRVTETFDKYNLLTLPVLQDDRLAGVITADDIISVLRHKE